MGLAGKGIKHEKPKRKLKKKTGPNLVGNPKKNHCGGLGGAHKGRKGGNADHHPRKEKTNDEKNQKGKN